MAGALPLNQLDVQYIAVHCSATPAKQDIGVPEITRMHRLRGFLTIGYHFVIRRDGTLETGRSLKERGAHVENYNHCSVGVCLVGGVDDKLKPQANFTPAQLVTLKDLLADLEDQFPKAQVLGHRDFPNVAKACPSFDVRTWLKTNIIKP